MDLIFDGLKLATEVFAGKIYLLDAVAAFGLELIDGQIKASFTLLIIGQTLYGRRYLAPAGQQRRLGVALDRALAVRCRVFDERGLRPATGIVAIAAWCVGSSVVVDLVVGIVIAVGIVVVRC